MGDVSIFVFFTGAEGTPKQKKKVKLAAAATVGAVVDSEGNAAVATTDKKVPRRIHPSLVLLNLGTRSVLLRTKMLRRQGRSRVGVPIKR